MLEDAYKSCPDVICIRAGISGQLSVVANVYFNGLLCNPCCVDLSGLICTFSAMPAHCFEIYYSSPIALLLATGGAKNVTPVGAQAMFSPRSARRLGAKGRRVGVGCRGPSLCRDKELHSVPAVHAGSLFYHSSRNK